MTTTCATPQELAEAMGCKWPYPHPTTGEPFTSGDLESHDNIDEIRSVLGPQRPVQEWERPCNCSPCDCCGESHCDHEPEVHRMTDKEYAVALADYESECEKWVHVCGSWIKRIYRGTDITGRFTTESGAWVSGSWWGGEWHWEAMGARDSA